MLRLGISNKRGSSFLIVFLMIPILVFLARAVHWLSTTSGHRANLHRKKVVAQYLVEAGQAHALAKLKADADWKEGFKEQTLDDVPGTYSMHFHTLSEEYQEGDSVNNITGTEYLDGPRGPKTVKPGTVEFVVKANVQGQEELGQAIFEAETKPLPSYGLGASGNIILRGDVSIRGIQSLANQVEVRAGVHSNSEGDGGPTIQWEKKEGVDRMVVKGTVTSSADDAESIELQGTEGVDYEISEIETDVAALPMPSTNIVETVDNFSNLNPPKFENFGTTRLNSGSSYYQGDANLQGDLVLNGHDLYVKGDLTVNGTIRGDGSVYVTGKTTLKGDSEIKASETGVALYSHGAVDLSGFNGKEYLASLRKENEQFERALAEYEGSFAPVTRTARRQKGGHTSHLVLYEDNRSAHAPGLLDSFEAKGLKGETASFIRKQLKKQADHELVEYDKNRRGGFMIRITYSREVEGRLVTAKPPEADFSKIGQAYFQGLIVSDHYVKTDNAVSVVGSLWSTGRHPDTGAMVDGKAVTPGDIILNNGTEVVMNRELLEEPKTATRDVTSLRLKSLLR